jgi:hypothetical protein
MKIIAVDPGASGALCVKNGNKISVFDMPLMKDKNGKKVIDLKALAALFCNNKDADLFVIEDVHCMPKNGAVSMFNFGRSKGVLEGMAFVCGFKAVYVSPQTWKKDYAELCRPKADKTSKVSEPITKKEKQDADREKRLFKANAKAKAREIAGTLYPNLADRFKTVNSDGRAEAVLIATYAENHFKE